MPNSAVGRGRRIALWAASLREIKKRIRPLFGQERVADYADHDAMNWISCCEDPQMSLSTALRCPRSCA